MRQDAQIVQVVPVRVRQFGGDRVDAQEEQACDDDGDAGQADRLGRAPVWKSTSATGACIVGVEVDAAIQDERAVKF